MDIRSRTPEVRKSHGESLVKMGAKIQESVIYEYSSPHSCISGKLFLTESKRK